MTPQISRQIRRVTGEKAKDEAVRALEKIGATGIKVTQRRPTRRKMLSMDRKRTKYQIGYMPPVTAPQHT